MKIQLSKKLFETTHPVRQFVEFSKTNNSPSYITTDSELNTVADTYKALKRRIKSTKSFSTKEILFNIRHEMYSVIREYLNPNQSGLSHSEISYINRKLAEIKAL